MAGLIVVSYDVRDDRRRTRLAKALTDFGDRVQLSVFECRLDERQLDRLSRRVAVLIDAAEDSVRIYWLCGGCAERVAIQGLGEVVPEPPGVYFV